MLEVESRDKTVNSWKMENPYPNDRPGSIMDNLAHTIWQEGFEACMAMMRAKGQYGTWWPLDERGISDFDNRVEGVMVIIPDDKEDPT